MLIEFSVSNYRSFREKQTFSMVAAPRLGKKGNVFKPRVNGEKIPDLLKAAAIYGPNASGKSNFITALCLINSLTSKRSSLSEPLPITPFRFDPSLANQPSRFEIHFIAKNQRYEFVVAATSERIMEERLTSFPKGQETLLYKRLHTSSGDEYTFGAKLEGEFALHEIWRKLTSPKTLFLTQAVVNSSEELQQLTIPFKWLNSNFRESAGDLEQSAYMALSIGRLHSELKMDKYISSFLQEIDVPITNIKFELEENNGNANLLTAYEENVGDIKDEDTRSFVKSYKNVKATLTHKTALGEAQFDFNEESEGTKNLIGFSLSWVLIDGKDTVMKSVAIDELDSSLHPKIVARLIDKLLKFETPAQLIFSTHDTHLMDAKLLRRDQLWITERDMNGATQLRSIHDFEGRESEDVEKRYYEGRYRGLPILR